MSNLSGEEANGLSDGLSESGMSGQMRSPEPVDVGDVIATGWKLYTTNFSQFAGIALKAYLFIFIPLMLFSAVTMLITLVAEQPETYARILALLVPVTVVLGLLGTAEFLGFSTGISRLSYQLLNPTDTVDISLDSPVVDENRETLKSNAALAKKAVRFSRSRRYSLLWQAILKGLIFFGVYIVFSIAALLLVVAAVATSQRSPAGGFSPASLIIGLLLALLVLAFVCLLIWLGTKIMLAEQSLVIEQESGAAKAIKRSWALTRGSVLRSLLVALVIYLITLPVTLAVLFGGQFLAYTVFSFTPPPVPGDVIDSFSELLVFVPGLVVNTVVSVIGGVITVPLWYTTLTTLYVALRKRITERNTHPLLETGLEDSPANAQ